MPFIISCTGCQKKVQVPDHAAGRNVRCPACSVVFLAQPPDAPEVAVTTAPPPLPPRLPPPLPRPAPPPEDAVADEPLLPRRRRDDWDEDGPSVRPHFLPVTFTVVVIRDPVKELKGTFTAKLTPDGLELRKGKRQELLVEVGTEAVHRSGSRFSLELDDRRVEFNLVKQNAYVQRLTADVVAFLNGDIREPDPDGYIIPWYLFVPALLPLGIPVLTLGGGLWIALAGGLTVGGLAIVRQERLPVALRILLPLLLAGVGYAIALALLILVFWWM